MALFQKRIDRSMDIMRERNRRYLEELEDQQKADEEKKREEAALQMGQNYAFRTDAYPRDGEEYLPEKEEIKLEKGDLFAIIASAFLVFWPIFLVLGVILVLALRALMR